LKVKKFKPGIKAFLYFDFLF